MGVGRDDGPRFSLVEMVTVTVHAKRHVYSCSRRPTGERGPWTAPGRPSAFADVFSFPS